MTLDAIALLPKNGQPPDRLLVLLHGWGANYHDLASLTPYLTLPTYQFLLPNAPFPHPYGAAGRMWYRFPEGYGFEATPNFSQQPDLVSSRQQLMDWLVSLEATTGISLSQTVIAGFSQGGAMTLDVGTRLPVGALVVLSGYLHAPLPAVSSLPPVLMVHGRYDSVVPLQAAQQARDSLVALGATVEYHELAMGHEILPEILEIMQSFLSKPGSWLSDRAETS